MFDTIADMLRGSAPDDLAHALGTDRTQTRRAMEIGLPALITGLRDKTLEPGGAQNLASMLGEPGAAVPADLAGYLAAGDPAQGAAMLDVAFGDRGEPALAALSSASGLSTRLLAQVMSVLAPLATGTVASVSDHSPDGLRSYLAGAVADLEGKGFGRVVELVSPAGVDVPAEVLLAELPIDLVDDVDDIGVVLADVDIDAPVLGELDATVVEGAFADVPDELVMLDDVDIDLGDPTEAVELGDSMPDFDADLASVVAPAGVPIAAEAAFSAPPVMLAEPDARDLVAIDPVVQEPELEGSGLSNMGWLWWLIGAVLGIILLLFAITKCGGSDGADVSTDGSETATAVPTPDPLVAQRQTTLDGILAAYPNVRGEVFGDVAVLDGTVTDETERALLDQAVRGAGLGVQNNVTATQAPAVDGALGYSLNDQIDAQPELSTLRTLLDQSGLGEALDGGGDFTLFAPTNDAFAAIADEITALQGDPAALQGVLLYHLLVGALDATAISAATELPTQLEGQTITVDASGELVVLNGSVSVLTTADPARNGILHIVGGVLLPSTEPVVPEELGLALGLAPISFSSGSTSLTDGAKIELDKVVAFLTETPANITIGGHTDGEGEADFNQRLSQQRADAVKTYLVEQGIPTESLTSVGFGEDQPVAPNDTAENKAKNRRIEFRPT